MATAQGVGAVPKFLSLWRSPKPVVAQLLDPVLDGLMRSTPETHRFIELVRREGVGAAARGRSAAGWEVQSKSSSVLRAGKETRRLP
jgi:hypothetical protein